MTRRGKDIENIIGTTAFVVTLAAGVLWLLWLMS